MKTEDQAWRSLQAHASAQLRAGFADRVLCSARGPDETAWRELQSHASAQLRPGFADRVLRAVRAFPSSVPSLLDQFALSAATAAFCVITVAVVHSRSLRLEDERNLATWQRMAAQVEGMDSAR